LRLCAELPDWTPMRLTQSMLLATLAISAWSLAPTAVAAPAATAPYVLAGPDALGKSFDLARQKGRVVMVFYWSTGCAVCRDKLPELRANLAGWQGKPFDLVLVSLDAKEGDWRQYEQLAAATRRVGGPQPVSLWRGAAGFRDALGAKSPRLPLTLVIGPDGQLAQRYEGRMAPEAWDTVAELLP
jgi:hypothetical protein